MKKSSQIRLIIRKIISESIQPNSSQEVYDEIEMRMRPTDDSLPYSELMDISNEYNIDFEDVIQIMSDYLNDRNSNKKEDLENTIKYIIDNTFEGSAPKFGEFLEEFKNEDDFRKYDLEEVRKKYKELTEDPNQMSMFEGIAGDNEEQKLKKYIPILKKINNTIHRQELINWFNENDVDYFNMSDLDMYIYYIENI